MSRSLPPNRTQTSQTRRTVRHAAAGKGGQRAAGAVVDPPATAAPNPVSAAASTPPNSAIAPIAETTVLAALTTFEGQAVYRIQSPGSRTFRAGEILRFAYGSRSAPARCP